ncbi:MAG: AMP-binding protein, partial [Smithella sp.]
MTINLIELLKNAVQKNTDRIAFISEKQYITYRQLNQAVNNIAGLIKRIGVGKGDKVAIMLP